MSRKIPDKWENYSPIGKNIEGTRFIAFKVPLRVNVSVRVKSENRLNDKILLQKIPNLGLIIDLTNTQRYYDPKVFQEEGVDYKKIMIPGQEIPPKGLTNYFVRVVKEFLDNNKDNDKLIGVHCTHGVNRTGYLICYYMISQMNCGPSEAVNKFANARGHAIERINYIIDLQRLKSVNDQNCREKSRRKANHENNKLNASDRWLSERYMDHHCTMSNRPRKINLDYYNMRPTFAKQRRNNLKSVSNVPRTSN